MRAKWARFLTSSRVMADIECSPRGTICMIFRHPASTVAIIIKFCLPQMAERKGYFWFTMAVIKNSTLAPLTSGMRRPGDLLPLMLDSAPYTRGDLVDATGQSRTTVRRSEEHTSELQSRFDLVCRLLLEKNK